MAPGRVACAQRVSRMAIWKVWRSYQEYGEDGLKDHTPGRLFEPLNPKFYKKVVEEWKRNRCGARKLHAVLKRQGFGVSLWKISQVMRVEGFQKPCPKRQKPRKYKRYEWPLPNYMWHTDWHKIKAQKLRGQQFISYLDDCSRRIMSHGVFNTLSTRASLIVLYKAISQHHVTPHLLNSDRGSEFIPSKFDKHGKANSAYQEALKELGIHFVPSSVRHPQTNGKLEKFHDILDKEFDDRFATIDEFIDWYNNKRLSEAVDHKTPTEAYNDRL